jgi:hypothetical protein
VGQLSYQEHCREYHSARNDDADGVLHSRLLSQTLCLLDDTLRKRCHLEGIVCASYSIRLDLIATSEEDARGAA